VSGQFRPIFDAEDLRDVRMIERRQCVRFACEGREPLGVLREPDRPDLKLRRRD
jgi:hypothetical protein